MAGRSQGHQRLSHVSFCNHIPAPPPVMPGPENLEQINPHIILPWSKARDPLHALMAHKPDKYNKWDHIKNKKWGTQDPNFHQPYTKESPSRDANYMRVHEDVMRHIYSPAADTSEPQVELMTQICW